MRKGVSSVIAVILLLLITIAIIGFAFVFFTRTVEISTKGGEEQIGQQIQRIGTNFQLEGVNKNQVFIRNMGATPLSGLAFYVNDVPVSYSGPASLAANAFGTYFLNDSQLAMLPDPAQLRVTSAGASSEMTANFYGAYIVGYWKFDEGSGITAIDSSGNGNGGTINGPTYTPGKYGTALNFDGINDYVDIPYSISLNLPGTDESVFLWLKPNGDNIFVQTDGWYRRLWLQGLGGDYRFILKLKDTSNIEYTLQSGVYPLNQWYLVGYTISGNTARLYVNGALQQQVALSNPIQPFSGGNWWFGRTCNGDCNKFYNGVIDEIQILKIGRSMTTS